MNKKVLKLYSKLCDEYNNGNFERICSFQRFLEAKYSLEQNSVKKSLILDVIEYAKTDF